MEERVMKPLAIKRALSEDTRLQSITLNGQVFDLHLGLGDDTNYYITEHGDETKIYAYFTKDIFDRMFVK